MTNAPVYSRQVVPAADCFDRYSRKRAARAKSSEMSIAVASSRCNSNADAHGAAVHGRSDPLDSDPRKIKTQTRGERGPSPRTTTALLPAPRDTGRSSPWDTPPNALARDHDRWQVSWLAGRRLRPPSQGQPSPVAFMAVGSPLTVAGAAAELHTRHCCRSTRTAFPWLSLAGTTVEHARIGFHTSQEVRSHANREGV